MELQVEKGWELLTLGKTASGKSSRVSLHKTRQWASRLNSLLSCPSPVASLKGALKPGGNQTQAPAALSPGSEFPFFEGNECLETLV